MTTYTFAKVEHRVTKSVKCDACGKRLKRSTTLFQTLSPFNKTSDGQLKTREQIREELLVKEQEWRAEREWCSPCFDATHLYAKDLTVGDVLESEVGDMPVVSLEVVKGTVGYGDSILVNAAGPDPITFSAYDRVVNKPAAA